MTQLSFFQFEFSTFIVLVLWICCTEDLRFFLWIQLSLSFFHLFIYLSLNFIWYDWNGVWKYFLCINSLESYSYPQKLDFAFQSAFVRVHSQSKLRCFLLLGLGFSFEIFFHNESWNWRDYENELCSFHIVKCQQVCDPYFLLCGSLLLILPKFWLQGSFFEILFLLSASMHLSTLMATLTNLKNQTNPYWSWLELWFRFADLLQTACTCPPHQLQRLRHT